MPKLKPEEIEHRRHEIIEAAGRCFLRGGFHQTTTDAICHEASITPGGLYHYFRSKEDLISAVITDSTRATVAGLRSTVEESTDLRSAIQALGQLFFQRARDPQLDSATRLDVEIWAETLRNEELAEITRGSRSLRRQWLESLIGQGIAEGVYTQEVNPKGLANLIMAIFDGLRLGRLLWKDDFDVEGALQALTLMHTGRLTNGQAAGAAARPAAAGKRLVDQKSK